MQVLTGYTTTESYVSVRWFSCRSNIVVELELRNAVLFRREKNPRTKSRSTNKLNPHLILDDTEPESSQGLIGQSRAVSPLRHSSSPYISETQGIIAWSSRFRSNINSASRPSGFIFVTIFWPEYRDSINQNFFEGEGYYGGDLLLRLINYSSFIFIYAASKSHGYQLEHGRSGICGLQN